MGSNFAQGIDVCFYSVVMLPLVRQRGCVGLIFNLKRPTDRVKYQETENSARVQERAVEPQMNEE